MYTGAFVSMKQRKYFKNATQWENRMWQPEQLYLRLERFE